jgi:hypothetical protein
VQGKSDEILSAGSSRSRATHREGRTAKLFDSNDKLLKWIDRRLADSSAPIGGGWVVFKGRLKFNINLHQNEPQPPAALAWCESKVLRPLMNRRAGNSTGKVVVVGRSCRPAQRPEEALAFTDSAALL